MRRLSLLVIVLFVSISLPSAAFGQDQPADPIEALQAADTLTDEQRTTLNTWVTERVTAAAGNDAGVSIAAAAELRQRFEGAEGFKRAYAEACVAAIGGAYKQAELGPATRLMALLNVLNDVRAYTVLVEALADKRVAVRTAAAVALRRLRVKLMLAGNDAVTATLNGLRDAGKRETSLVAMQAIYRALDFQALPNPPDAKLMLATILDVLESRAEQYARGKVPAEGADAPGLKLAGALLGSMSDDERKRFTTAIGKMLRYSVTRYTSGDEPLYKVLDKTSGKHICTTRNNIEMLIEEAEKQLKALLSLQTPPDITTKMQDNKSIDMKIEMNKWATALEAAVNLKFYMEESAAPEEGEDEDG